MKNILGDEYEAFINSYSESIPVSLRLNPLKPITNFDSNNGIPWCTYGKYLTERPDFVFDPLIHAGCYYVQEASSMLFANAIDFSKDLRILDLCAAPGGKSSLILSLMSQNSLLISNELVRKRAGILYENLTKWGSLQSIIISQTPESFAAFSGYFDVVVVDAPCSGEGMFRKEPELIREWAENKPFICSITQKNILDEAVQLLKSDGLLIYMTCTYSPEENEQIVEWFTKKYSSIITLSRTDFKEEWGLTKIELGSGYVWHSYPHRVKGEGLFIAVFNVKNQKLPSVSKKHLDIFKQLSKSEKEKLKSFIDPDFISNAFKHNEKVYVLPNGYFIEAAFLLNKFNALKCGVFVGSFNYKNGDFIPSHELAMSVIVNKNDITQVNLNYRQALQYLKKMNILSDDFDNISNGWFLATYQHQVLGWLKKTKDKINNLYPKDWVIRKKIED